jgi:hypothetical protein
MRYFALVLALPFTVIYDLLVLIGSVWLILMMIDDAGSIWPVTPQVVAALIKD